MTDAVAAEEIKGPSHGAAFGPASGVQGLGDEMPGICVLYPRVSQGWRKHVGVAIWKKEKKKWGCPEIGYITNVLYFLLYFNWENDHDHDHDHDDGS